MTDRSGSAFGFGRGWGRHLVALVALVGAAVTGCGSDAADAPAQTPGLDDDGSEAKDASTSHSSASAKKDAGTTSSHTTGSTTAHVGDAGATSDSTKSGGQSSSDGGATTSGEGWCEAKRVFDKHCTSCHDGQGTGGSPMGLTSYEDLVAADPGAKTKKVYEVVGTRIHDTAKPMPPKNTLTAAELKALDTWIAAGAPKSEDASCSAVASADAGTGAVAPGEPVNHWDPSECDAVYKLTSNGGSPGTPMMVPAGQETHPSVTLDAPWGNEAVQAINFHPITDNKKVLHHWILYSNAGAFLTGWAPGDDERQPFADDVGMEMPSGPGSLRLDMHYFNVGGTQSEPDQSGLEVCVVKQAHFRKNHAAVTMALASFGPVLAPAMQQNHEATGTCSVTTTQPVHLLTASPHAHKYAKAMKFWVKKKDGTQVVMHDHTFTFGEQGSYPLDPEVIVESGDTIYTTCIYSNDTNKDITFGESTSNEMCFNFAVYYPSGALNCGFGGGLLGL